MKRKFKDLQTYVKLFDGMGKPKLDWQQMYKLFPDFEFEATRNFGQYKNFGQAFERKDLSMIVSDGTDKCLLVYYEYGDANENTAYVTEWEG